MKFWDWVRVPKEKREEFELDHKIAWYAREVLIEELRTWLPLGSTGQIVGSYLAQRIDGYRGHPWDDKRLRIEGRRWPSEISSFREVLKQIESDLPEAELRQLRMDKRILLLAIDFAMGCDRPNEFLVAFRNGKALTDKKWSSWQEQLKQEKMDGA